MCAWSFNHCNCHYIASLWVSYPIFLYSCNERYNASCLVSHEVYGVTRGRIVIQVYLFQPICNPPSGVGCELSQYCLVYATSHSVVNYYNSLYLCCDVIFLDVGGCGPVC